jgi:hypothetical protein
MAFLIWLTFLIVGAVGTLVILRWVAHVRGARLDSLIPLEEASWMALCRVMAEGRFLDDGRRRRGMGPRGTLVSLADRVEWRPDRYESRHGDKPMSWPAMTWSAWRVGNGGISQVCGLHRPISACRKDA